MKTTKLKVIALATLTILSGFACKKDKVEPKEPNLIPKHIELTAKAPQVIKGGNDFGIELFTRVADGNSENLMLSPLSASIALTMVLNGSENETYEQLLSALKYPSDIDINDINEAYKSLVNQLLNADPKVKIAIANALFYRLGFHIKPPYLATMSNVFSSDIEGLDFNLPSALSTINQWANENTFGKIPKVLDEISADAVMFLMNALYFKGDWSYQFDRLLTDSQPFRLDNGTTINAETMQGEVGARIHFGTNYRVLEMPYGRTNFTMVVIVPEETLQGFYPQLTGDEWNQITENLDGQTDFYTVNAFLPKFNFSYEDYLESHLKSMGMVDAFIPFVADFSGITDDPIYISFVKQNTFVEVNEEGTEAAAVTTIGFDLESIGPGQPPVFKVDRPFVFAIRERTTNTLMFIGHVTDPR